MLNKWSTLHVNTFCTSAISGTLVLQMIRQSSQRILSLIILDSNAQINPCFSNCSFVCTILINMGDIPYRDGLCPRAEGLPLMSQHSHVARAPRDNSESVRKAYYLIFEFTDSFVKSILRLLPFFLAMPLRIWDPSSLTRDWTHDPWSGCSVFDYWTTKEVPGTIF